MLKIKLSVAIVFLFCLGFKTIQAQESMNTTGGMATGSGGSMAYTVGQVAFQTHTGTNGSIAEGIHQPYEILVATGLEEAKSINLTVSAYPNPTNDYLTLEVNDFKRSNLHFQLYDMNGKLLQSEQITRNQTSIFLNNLIPAYYFIKVIQGDSEVKIFKVIKN